MAKTRRQIGGRIWNRDIEQVKRSVARANRAANEILDLINRNRNMPYVAAISMYLTAITTSLNDILQALDSLVATAEDYKDTAEPGAVWDECFEDTKED